MVTSWIYERRPLLLVYSVLVTAAFVLSGCDGNWDYDVFVQYYCMDFNGHTGYCSSWQQIGEIKAPYGACFPGNAVVMSEDGLLSMQNLRVGDRILGIDHNTGRQSFSEVRGWLHRNPLQTMSMMELHTEDGRAVVASPGHMLALSNASSGFDRADAFTYRRASDIQPGDTLVSANGSSLAVEETMATQMEGLFAPLTMHSNYFVGSGEADASKLILAHSFANVADPQRYERFWHGLLSVVETIVPPFSDSEVGPNGDYLHPVARVLMRLLGVTPLEPMVFEVELDMGDMGEVKGRRLASTGGSGFSDDDWMMFFMSLMQTTVLPPFLANPPIPPTSPTDSFTRSPTEFDDDDDGVTPLLWHILWVTALVLVCCCCLAALCAAAGGAAGGSSNKSSRYDAQDGTPAESRPLAEGAAYYDDDDYGNYAGNPNYASGPYGAPPGPPGWQSGQQPPPPGSWSGSPPQQQGPWDSGAGGAWGSQTPNWGSQGPPSAGPATPGPPSGHYPSGPPSLGPGQTMPPYQSAPNPYQSAANPYDTAPPYYAQSYPS